MLHNESDELLLARLRDHNEHALRELLTRYFDRLAAFALSLVRSRDLAEEAVSNVFLQLWRRREALQISGTVRSYLFAAVGNQSLTLRKQLRRHQAVQLEDVPPPQLIDARRTETELVFREFQAEIEAVILRLPPQRQLIFRLNRLEGLRYSEIAAALGVSTHTVQNHMVQAIKQLAPDLPELRNNLSP